MDGQHATTAHDAPAAQAHDATADQRRWFVLAALLTTLAGLALAIAATMLFLNRLLPRHS